jgi:hypothetical protein
MRRKPVDAGGGFCVLDPPYNFTEPLREQANSANNKKSIAWYCAHPNEMEARLVGGLFLPCIAAAGRR